MSISKTWVASAANQEAVLSLYRSPELLRMQDVAAHLGTTFQNVQYIVNRWLPPEEAKALKALRYSDSKVADKNPMKGKTGARHHNWIGECEDGRGYLTALWNGKRHFVHRIVMMEALGIAHLDPKWEVHHIDGDPKNNALDNLALTTAAGHGMIHFLQQKDSKALLLKRSTLAAAFRSLTSE